MNNIQLFPSSCVSLVATSNMSFPFPDGAFLHTSFFRRFVLSKLSIRSHFNFLILRKCPCSHFLQNFLIDHVFSTWHTQHLFRVFICQDIVQQSPPYSRIVNTFQPEQISPMRQFTRCLVSESPLSVLRYSFGSASCSVVVTSLSGQFHFLYLFIWISPVPSSHLSLLLLLMLKHTCRRDFIAFLLNPSSAQSHQRIFCH